MTDLEQIRLWEKEEAAKRMRLLGKCIFLDLTNIKETRKYLINTPGHWRKCDKYETTK